MSKQSIKQGLRRALQAISWIGLALSLLTLIVSAPHLIQVGGGIGMILGNVAQFAWTLALLLLVFAKTRTIGAALAGSSTSARSLCGLTRVQ